MKLTVIGFWGGYPKVNGATSGYLLEEEGFRLLIDCGSGVISKLQNYISPLDLDACIISHYHADHIADIGVLQHALIVQKFITKHNRKIDIYGHPYESYEFEKLTYKDVTKGIPYEPEKTLHIGPFTVTFLKTIHSVECYAFRIEAGGKTLVYTADSAYQEAMIDFAKGADLLLSECNFYAHMDGSKAGHMNSLEAGRIAKEASVGKLILTHLPHAGNLEDLVREAGEIYNGPISLAEEGQVLII